LFNLYLELDYLDLARFQDFELTAFNTAITTKQYTFEVWIYSQTYVAGKFNTYSFIWNKYLRVDIKGKTPNYSSTCYPLYEESNANKLVNKQDADFTSDRLPWVYLRCSVNIATKKFFHYQEKSFTTEQTLNTSVTDVLTGTASLKFVNDTKNRGVLFFRLLRLYNCYECNTVDYYRINWINVDIIKNQLVNNNLLYHVDGKITGYDTIDRSNDNAETVQKISYILDNTGVIQSSPLVPLSTTDFLGYNVLDFDTTNKYAMLDSNYLCAENTYFCTGLVKLNEVTDVNISSVTPSLSGKYTLEFWTMITSVSNLSNGFHIIWKGVGSVTLIRDNTNNNSLNMVCWPQDFKFSNPNVIENNFGNNIYTILGNNSIPNFEKKTRSSNINNKWLYVRCAVNTILKKFYSVLEDETVGTVTENTMTTTTPMSPSFSGGATTYVLLNGMSENSSCTIYLRNLWLYANYLLPNNNTRHL